MLELLKFPTQHSATVCCANTIPLLYMTEDMQKDIDFHRIAFKINGMVIAWDVFDVCDREIILEGRKRPMGFRFFSSR